MNHKTLIYCRVSSARQGEKDCVSLVAQEAKIREIAKGEHLQIVHEIGSAFYAQQPKLRHAVSELKEGDQIYVYSYDRMSRNMQRFLDLLEDLEKRKIKVVSATEPIDYSQASGRMHLMTVIANAECQSRTISQKVKTAYQFRKTNGLLKPKKRKEYFDTKKQDSILLVLIGLRSGRRTVEEINLLLKEIVPSKVEFSPLVIDGVKGEPVDRPTANAISFNNISTILFDYGLTPKKMNPSSIRKIYKENKDVDMSVLEERLEKMKVGSKQAKEAKEVDVAMVMDVTSFTQNETQNETQNATQSATQSATQNATQSATAAPCNPTKNNDFNLEELFKQMNILKEKVEQHLKTQSL